MNDLFHPDETLSPRLKWMRYHGIRTYRNDYMGRPWMAIVEQLDLARGDSLAQYERGETEDEALVMLAKRLNLKLWNE